MRTIVSIGILILAIAGCSHAVPGTKLLSGIETHDCIVRARVIEVGDSPGYWSGIFVAVQNVKYEVLEVYKGQELVGNNNSIGVNHILVGGGPVEGNTPGVSPQILYPGVEVVLFIKSSFPGLKEGLYIVGDDKFGTLFVRNGELSTK